MEGFALLRPADIWPVELRKMDEAPRDGITRLLVLDADGATYRQCDGYWNGGAWIEKPSHMGIAGEYISVVTPVAFAIINRPWEDSPTIADDCT
jgi:hypothetical protein